MTARLRMTKNFFISFPSPVSPPCAIRKSHRRQGRLLRLLYEGSRSLLMRTALLLSIVTALVLASDLKAQPEQEQAEKTAVDHALSDYSDAFGRGDLSAIGQHCDVPFVRISSQG